MNLKNCSQCGKLFVSTGGVMCSECLEVDKKDAALVTDYIREHPGLMILEVAARTGISERKIRRYLKDGIIHNSY